MEALGVSRSTEPEKEDAWRTMQETAVVIEFPSSDVYAIETDT